jgi:hypothetical protein
MALDHVNLIVTDVRAADCLDKTFRLCQMGGDAGVERGMKRGGERW